MLDTSVLSWGRRYSPCWSGRRPVRYGMVACFHHMVSHGQGTTRRSPFLSRSNTWPLSSSWNPSAYLALVFELRRYLSSDAERFTHSFWNRLFVSGSDSLLPSLSEVCHNSSSGIRDSKLQGIRARSILSACVGLRSEFGIRGPHWQCCAHDVRRGQNGCTHGRVFIPSSPIQPKKQLKTLWGQSVFSAAPKLWNCLPISLREHN